MVAYVAVLNDDDTPKMGIPLYVKVTGDMSQEQENLTKETAVQLVRKYQKQIMEHFENLKKGGQNNENQKLQG